MLRQMIIVAFSLYHTAAAANFLTGFIAYEKKDYATAHYEFSALLPLGNEQAAFNLAAMASNGEGQSKDPVKALAYFELAAALGHPDAATMAEKIKRTLNAGQSSAANTLFSRLTQSVVIDDVAPDDAGPELEAIKRVAPEYPVSAARNNQFGYVTIRYLVDEQGSVIAVDALDSFPEQVFERSAMQAVKRWKYQATGKKQIGSVKMTFSMGPLRQKVLENWLEKHQIWAYAAAGSPQHQEALGSILHLIHNNSGLELTQDEQAAFSQNALPAQLFAKNNLHRTYLIENFHGYAKVSVNKKGVVEQILSAKNQQAASAESLLLHKPLPGVKEAGVYSLVSQLDKKVLISKVVPINPLYQYDYWWRTAAKNGDLRAQRFLAATHKQWENYLLSKEDPQVQTWVGARMLLDGHADQGQALLAKARAKNYPLALELTDAF